MYLSIYRVSSVPLGGYYTGEQEKERTWEKWKEQIDVGNREEND